MAERDISARLRDRQGGERVLLLGARLHRNGETSRNTPPSSQPAPLSHVADVGEFTREATQWASFDGL